MGGGDLNSKKSWHPNTMKNQERVWKAEQAAAEEKKRILELQRERAEERTRSELNDLAKRNSGSVSANDESRLHWMYDKPDKKAKDEDYLLGKTIEANYGQSEKTDADVIPAVARRVVGSSMLTSVGDLQVDLARKIREDPLVLVKERERAARAALLNNPLQRRRLTALLRKDQEQAKVSKKKKKSEKKNLDNLLADKISSLGGDKKIDLVALIASDDSSSDSSSEDEKEKRKKTKKKHKKTKKKTKKLKKKLNKSSDDDTQSSDSDKKEKCSSKHKNKKQNGLVEEKHRDRKSQLRKKTASHTEIRSSREKKDHKYDSNEEDRMNDSRQRVSPKRSRERNNEMAEQWKRKRYNDTNKEERFDRHNSSEDRIRDRSRHMTSSTRCSERESEMEDRWKRKKREVMKHETMSEGERAAKLAEMAAAGAQRELERGRRVAEQRAADVAADAAPRQPRGRNEARALPDSLESRIHSNRHYIQRDQRYMNEHFARR